ncbi:unnamed protein product [Penicillium discolor]
MSPTIQARTTYRALLRELPRRNFKTPSPLHQQLHEERTLRVHEADQFAQYARAQRVYSDLLERYNPGMSMDEEEKIRLTARRVGFDLPELHVPEGNE